MKTTSGALLPQQLLLLLMLPLQLWQQANGANILCIVGTPAHNRPGWTQPFFEALADRGHQLTVYSTHVTNALIPNIEQIPLTNDYDVLKKHYIDRGGYYKNCWNLMHLSAWREAQLGICRSTIESQFYKHFQMPDTIFDLVIYDATYSVECLIAKLASYQSVPMLGLSSGKLTKELLQLVHAENTISAVTIPHYLSQLPLEMSYWNNVMNHIMYFTDQFIQWAVNQPILEGMMGNDYNPGVQVMLLNTHPALDYVQNMPPNVIEVGGLQIRAESGSVPFGIQEFIQRFTAGVVYINLPHIDLMNVGLPAIEKMAKNFSQLGFLWNLNDSKPEHLSDIFNNLHIVNLADDMQQNILAQSNVKVLMTHGDSFSIQEAIYNAVPIIVLPLLMDQMNNAQRLEERRLGVHVSASGFDVDSLSVALKQLIRDDDYMDVVRQAQLNFRTRQVKPLDTAVWYAEQLISQPDLFAYLSVSETSGPFYQTLKSMEVLILPILVVIFFIVNVVLTIYQKISQISKPKYKKQEKQKGHKNSRSEPAGIKED